jgi:hypothetical protein
MKEMSKGAPLPTDEKDMNLFNKIYEITSEDFEDEQTDVEQGYPESKPYAHFHSASFSNI